MFASTYIYPHLPVTRRAQKRKRMEDHKEVYWEQCEELRSIANSSINGDLERREHAAHPAQVSARDWVRRESSQRRG
jgi:hypothetical protein